MKKIILMVAAALFSASAAVAQDYNWAVGLRGGGETGGLTAKHKFNATNAVEFMLGYPWDEGFVVTALYERHVPVLGPGINLYYGAGAQLGSWDRRFSLGAAAVGGVEWKFRMVPVAVSLDYKPVLNIVEDTKFHLLDIGLAVKFTF